MKISATNHTSDMMNAMSSYALNKISFEQVSMAGKNLFAASCRSTEGRRAMLAHREAKEITL